MLFVLEPTPIDDMLAFLTGSPTFAFRANQLVQLNLRSWQPSLYAQDNWRVTHWLTLNYGARYDVFTAPTEANGHIANFDLQNLQVIVGGSGGVKTDYRDLAPRIGFAATARPGLVVRGGFGTSCYPSDIQNALNLLNPPFNFNAGTFVTDIAVGMPDPVEAPYSPSSVLTGQLSSKALNYRSAYVEQFNLLVEKEVKANVFRIGYVGELGKRQLLAIPNIALPPPTGPYVGPPPPPPPLTTAAELPLVSSIYAFLPEGYSAFHALQASFERRYSHGLTLNANYMWAHSIDDLRSGSNGGGGTGVFFGLLPDDIAKYDKGNSDFDIRHRIAISANYELPFGKSASGAMKQVIAGWQVNGIGYWQSGLPFTVGNTLAQINLPGVTTDRPDQIAPAKLSHPTNSEWFNIDAFAYQAFGTPGDEARNQIYGPPQRRIDLSLFKTFSLRENLKLQFRAECYNITNTPNFDIPDNAITATTTLNGRTVPAAGSGIGQIINTALNNGPREFQFALKLLF
jgi:hypothetical protein